jgi:hypothetical protein
MDLKNREVIPHLSETSYLVDFNSIESRET